MKFKILFLILIATTNALLGQATNATVFLAKEYSKETAFYYAKSFVMTSVLGITSDVAKFQIDPLAASNSQEIISLVYKCDEKNKEGLVLGFFGEKFHNNGIRYTEYDFKSLPKDKADEMLAKIENATDANNKCIDSDPDNNNIYFKYDDITFLIYKEKYNLGLTVRIRVFWNDFDAEWEYSTFKKTRRRLNRKLD